MIHPTTKKWTKILFSPIIALFGFLSVHNPKLLIQIRYFLVFHKFPDLKNPKNLNEKILYLKLFTDTTKWTDLTDKYKVREYVKKRGLSDFLVPLLAVWRNSEDINYDDLPNSFIMKANNGGGNTSVKIIKDKSKLSDSDKKQLRLLVEKWLNTSYKKNIAAEPQVRDIKPCVVVEELLQTDEGKQSLVDYKIWCFNGKAYYIWVVNDRVGLDTHVMTYDLNWVAHPEYSILTNHYKIAPVIAKPQNLDVMLQVAETLSAGFPCVRVDLYNVKGKVYFGEMTFTSQGGLMDFYTEDFLNITGALIKL
jgi:hypothetical protein